MYACSGRWGVGVGVGERYVCGGGYRKKNGVGGGGGGQEDRPSKQVNH